MTVTHFRPALRPALPSKPPLGPTTQRRLTVAGVVGIAGWTLGKLGIAYLIFVLVAPWYLGLQLFVAPSVVQAQIPDSTYLIAVIVGILGLVLMGSAAVAAALLIRRSFGTGRSAGVVALNLGAFEFVLPLVLAILLTPASIVARPSASGLDMGLQLVAVGVLAIIAVVLNATAGVVSLQLIGSWLRPRTPTD